MASQRTGHRTLCTLCSMLEVKVAVTHSLVHLSLFQDGAKEAIHTPHAQSKEASYRINRV